MAYCTYANILAALDQRTVAELTSDTGVPSSGPNAVVTELIAQAQGEIDMYIRVGDRYTAANIADLEAAQNPTLARLTVDLTIELLFLRRGRTIPDGVMGRIERTRAVLADLSKGALIFGAVANARQAGLPTVQAVPTQTTAYYGGSYASQFYPPIRGTVAP
mgnify:CR=1 FL=1